MLKKIALFILATIIIYPTATTITALHSYNKKLIKNAEIMEVRLQQAETEIVVLQENMLFLEEQLEEKVVSRSGSELFHEIETIITESAIITNEKEVNLFERVIEAEFGGCSYEAKLMGATVVMNRVFQWEDTITNILLAPGQFSVVSNGSINKVEVSESTKQAVKDALSGKRNLDENVLYFWADWLSKKHPLWNKKIATSCDGTIFAY